MNVVYVRKDAFCEWVCESFCDVDNDDDDNDDDDDGDAFFSLSLILFIAMFLFKMHYLSLFKAIYC